MVSITQFLLLNICMIEVFFSLRSEPVALDANLIAQLKFLAMQARVSMKIRVEKLRERRRAIDCCKIVLSLSCEKIFTTCLCRTYLHSLLRKQSKQTSNFAN
jgi:hypothetical protein